MFSKVKLITNIIFSDKRIVQLLSVSLSRLPQAKGSVYPYINSVDCLLYLPFAL